MFPSNLFFFVFGCSSFRVFFFFFFSRTQSWLMFFVLNEPSSEQEVLQAEVACCRSSVNFNFFFPRFGEWTSWKSIKRLHVLKSREEYIKKKCFNLVSILAWMLLKKEGGTKIGCFAGWLAWWWIDSRFLSRSLARSLHFEPKNNCR